MQNDDFQKHVGVHATPAFPHVPVYPAAAATSAAYRFLGESGGLALWEAIFVMTCRDGEKTMRLTFLTTLCMIMLYSGFPGAARAQEYPWCVGTTEGRVECSFSTYEQCQWTASGIGGCFQNPRASMSDGATRSPSSTRRPRSR